MWYPKMYQNSLVMRHLYFPVSFFGGNGLDKQFKWPNSSVSGNESSQLFDHNEENEKSDCSEMADTIYQEKWHCDGFSFPGRDLDSESKKFSQC